jgi:hypothetical protein
VEGIMSNNKGRLVDWAIMNEEGKLYGCPEKGKYYFSNNFEHCSTFNPKSRAEMIIKRDGLKGCKVVHIDEI